ncbi:ShlB/FhaC/HecB family hemolysin secretion/activation protein [Flavobacterium dauae]|uniref:ShlB/FhaC/HecB family hemolysin secretion/activation protein n=1 Tax=Flavobacterium dauae TaxID=1563479 RepID=UPI00101C7448|nr:ShlB/FhaC/HecB family hemolysin secretion/activation protein [Flavobacterium dauae]WLD23352.1 ShlB/FhaC/HecB family hemolysin secretion/activation protein [Flavobacterium dauae]
MLFSKKFLYLLFLILATSTRLYAQQIYLKVNGKNTSETSFLKQNIKDSIFNNGQEVETKLIFLQDFLKMNGYLHHQITSSEKKDSLYIVKFNLGKKTDSLKINFNKHEAQLKQILQINEPSKTIAIQNTESFLKSIVEKLAKKGYSISTVKLTNHQFLNNLITADLDLHLDEQRRIDQLVFTPYNNFPTGIKQRLIKKYEKQPFTDAVTNELQKEMSQFPFIKTTKQPEVLFTESNTALYLYVERQNISQFDGLIGFTNDDNGKVQFNGYADLQLMNILNKGEQLKLYWKNDGNQQTQFNLSGEVPYLFNTPFGLKASLELFKQDSTMMNTKFNAAVLYYLNFNHRVGVGYQSTSSVAGTENFYQAADYNNQFITLNYLLNKYQDHPLFRQKYYVTGLAGFGSKTEEQDNRKGSQQFINLTANYLWQINNRWYINQQLEGSLLHSAIPLLYNEYYRFGGIHSIRGFKENSLLAKTQIGLYNEARYLLAPNMYIHSITDVAYYEGENTNDLLYSFGLGFGIQTGGGLFNIIYANGIQPNTDFKLSNSIFHLSYKTQF